MKTKYSTIPIEAQSSTSLEKEEKGNLLSDMTGENGLITSVLDVEVVDEILSTSIYNKPEVAIREVLNNALRQCRTAEKLGASPRINIIFDVKNNRLIFEEIDSMGMPVQIFKDVYIHTGRSGNLDGSESGQFGIGKKSYRAIADTMIFETYARETKEKYAFMAKGKYFEEITTPNLNEFGSRVSFAIKEGVNLADLAKYVTNISRFTQVKIYLEFTDDLKENPNHTTIAFDKGITQISPVDKKEFLAKKLENDNLVWLEIDKEDYSVLFAFSGNYRRDRVMHNNLVGIPISLGETEETEHERAKQNELPDAGFAGYILNIKDERKYPPVASRDYIKQDSFEKLSAVIQSDLEEYFSQIKVETIQDYKQSEFKFFVDSLPYGGFNEVMPQSTLNFNKLLKLKVYSFDCENKEEGKHHWSDINTLFEKEVEIVCNYNKTMRRISRVLEYSSSMVVLVPDGNKHDRHSALYIMEKAGIQSISEFMKAKNIKLPKSEIQGEVTVRRCNYSNGVDHLDIDELDKFCIRVPKENLEDTNISEFVRNVTSSEYTEYGFLRDQKKLEDSASITLEEFLTENKKKEFVTSQGKMTGRQIMKKSLIIVIRPHKSKYSDMLTFEFVQSKHKKTLVILDDGQDSHKVNSFLLAYKVNNPEYDFNVLGDQYDSSIASSLVSPLNLEIEGNWKDEPKAALFYLGEIKDPKIRELYAMAYSKVYEYNSEGWQSDKQEDITEHNALHKVFAEMENQSKTHTILEQSQKFLELNDTSHKFSEKLNSFFEELLKSEIKKIVKDKDRVETAAQICLKDKIKENSLVVSIEKEATYSPDVTLNFEVLHQVKLSKNLFELVCDSIEGYHSLESVSIDGNKIEVVLG